MKKELKKEMLILIFLTTVLLAAIISVLLLTKVSEPEKAYVLEPYETSSAQDEFLSPETGRSKRVYFNDKELNSAEKSVAVALLKYSGNDSDFKDRLNPSQSKVVHDTLYSLRNKDFIVIEQEVVLVNPGDLKIYEAGDFVYLVVKGRQVVLSDLNDFKPKDCDENDPFQHVMCYIDNAKKENPNIKVGENKQIKNYIEDYLSKNVPDFYDNYYFENTSSELWIVSKKEFVPGVYLTNHREFDKASYVDSMREYEKSVFDYDNLVFVLDEGFVAVRKDFIYGEEVGRMYSLSGNVVGGFSKEDCNGTYFGLPCNNRGAAYLGLGRSSISFYVSENKFKEAIEAFDQRVNGYGVVIKQHEVFKQSVDDKWITDLWDEDASLLFTFFHDDKKGNLGPLECLDGKSAVKVRKKEVEALHEGLWDECVGKENLRLAGENSVCPKGQTEVWLDVSCFNKLKDGTVHAFHGAFHCFSSLSFFPSVSHTFATTTLFDSLIIFDFKLLGAYLLGIGPSPCYMSDYTILPGVKTHNLYTTNYHDFGGPKYSMEMTSLDEFSPVWVEEENDLDRGYCARDDGVPIPCQVPISGGAVHLYPYVSGVVLSTALDKSENRVDFKFSDSVTQPGVKLADLNGKEYSIDLKEVSDDCDVFSYVFPIEIEPYVFKDEVERLSQFKDNFPLIRGNLFGFYVSDAKSIIEDNPIEMLGDPYGIMTYKNENHNLAFYLPDMEFWRYNARFFERSEGNKLFKAAIPARINPFVDEVTSHSVGFSMPVKGGDASEFVSAEVGAGCEFEGEIFTEKPNFLGTGENGFERIRWTFNDDLDIVSVSKEGVSTSEGVKDWMWVWKNWGSSFNLGSGDYIEWDDDYAITLTVSGIESFNNNEFKLLGNTHGNSDYWYFDSNSNEVPDYLDTNSHKLPQKEGNFVVKFPCEPKRKACCLPVKDDWEQVVDYSCSNMFESECKWARGEFHKESTCLNYLSSAHFISNEGVVGKCEVDEVSCAYDPSLVKITYSTSCAPNQSGEAYYFGYFVPADKGKWYFTSEGKKIYGEDKIGEFFNAVLGYRSGIYYEFHNGLEKVSIAGSVCNVWGAAHTYPDCSEDFTFVNLGTQCLLPNGSLQRGKHARMERINQDDPSPCCRLNEYYSDRDDRCIPYVKGTSPEGIIEAWEKGREALETAVKKLGALLKSL